MARLAVEHLVGLGHRRFGMLGYPVPSHDMTTADANARTGRLVLEGTAARDQGQFLAEERMLRPELIVRQTTGPLRGAQEGKSGKQNRRKKTISSTAVGWTRRGPSCCSSRG
ncbi:MAG: hypothetical protein A3K19_14295 [Lentisphaerae bacterium RIFOXYB12_FULL_65_16]|nr:MAG: hypothetical protein A3K18_18340 [Lentisphaerae bacterium RIFOXYA12_64_32]OGV87393.1 MAG: hypothetical protein A3K19_14295 [Lentisphaerae bacterium RIFOXYB12_FULL_65_16]